MAVSASYSPVNVTLTAALQTVSIPFAFYDTSDLVVYKNGTVQTLGTHYQVAGGNGATGSVVMLTGGPTTGDKVIVDRQLPLTHTGDFVSSGPMPGPSVTKLFDRVVYLIQQLNNQIGRVLRFTISTGAQNELSLSAPSVVGSINGTSIAMLTGTQLAELINLDGSNVNRPTKTFTDATARGLSVPDFVGQLGVQLDASGSSALYKSNGTSAGNWEAAGASATVADGAIGTAKLANDAVTSDKIAAGAVGSSEIANGAVGSNQIATGAVGADELAAGAVTTDKIAALNIVGAHVANRTIPGGKLEANTITPSEMANSPYILKGITRFTSGTAATYTVPAGVRAIFVEVIGAGGGGGGVPGAPSSNGAHSRSGGGGGYAAKFIAINASHAYKYTIGAGGAGGSAGQNAGAAGGTTTFFDGASGTTVAVRATGGSGGTSGAAATSNQATIGAAGGSGDTGDILLTGRASTPSAIVGGVNITISFPGSAPYFDGGLVPEIDTAGVNGNNYGVGGSGARSNGAVNVARAGGNGSGGLIIITEYY